MAKKVYKEAGFEPCTNAIPAAFDLLARISLLALLPPRTKDNIEKFRGALRLRRFAAGDLICRQGEEDCTAFYILKTEDLVTVRKYPQQKRLELEDEKASLQKQLATSTLPPKKSKELQDKLAVVEAHLTVLPALASQAQEMIAPIGVPREQLELLASAGVRNAAVDSVDRQLESILAACRSGDEADKELDQAENNADKAKAALAHDLRTADPDAKRARSAELQKSDPRLAEQLQALALAEDLRRAAVAVLASAGKQSRGGVRAWLNSVRNRLSKWSGGLAPHSIPFDGPTDLNYRSRTAPLREGELFGEMACMNRSPRSANVVATRDCYMLEMLSNVLAEIDKDPQYRKARDDLYKKRVIDLQLRDLSIFRTLSDGEYARVINEIRSRLELVSFPSGALICDEHERSDCVYLVRSGLVQVKRSVSSLLVVDDVLSWQTLAAALAADSGPAAAVRKVLSAEVRDLIDRPAETLSAADRAAIVYGLNDVIASRGLAAQPEFKELVRRSDVQQRIQRAALLQSRRAYDPKELKETVETASVREYTEELPEKTEQWSELDQRRLHRLLLQEALPGCLRGWQPNPGPEAILNYCSRGEFIGEMGVFLRRPRGATCIAYAQPQGPQQEELGRVELVRLPAEIFRKLVDEFPAVRHNVEREIERREQQNAGRLQPRPAEAHAGVMSEQADELGLVQGQRLMLIDMQRCTQCGECVRACENAHADGRSRLFLYGHRFENYLVPITCRSCLDPVCMVGCPVRSIQRGDNQQMQIKDWCIGCGICARNCPYDAIKMHPIEVAEQPADAANGLTVIQFPRVAVVCDLCSDLPGNAPRCVYACPHEAATRVNARAELSSGVRD